MTQQQADPPIIIVTGGSVSIEFPETDFQREGKAFKNETKKIDSIEVSVNGGTPTTFNVNSNGVCSIKITYK